MLPASPVKAAGFIASLCIGLTLGPALAEEVVGRKPLDIPAQPLADAIVQLSDLTHAAIIAPAELVSGKMSTPVFGVSNTAVAIDRMLKGAGLVARLDASGVFIIGQAPATKTLQSTSDLAPADPETVTIYGAISGGLARALDIKRGADSIVDAVVASDIGKLPAVNAAEALQHLVGVTVSREAGEGEFIGVRGLGPNFQTVTFNGVPLAVNENIRNSDQSGRQFRFRVLPADLISSIVVTKSPTADLLDGGIGANIDIAIKRPLQCDPFVGFRLYGSWDEHAGSVTPNGSLSACWRAPGEKLGILGGFSFQHRNAQFDRVQNFGYDARMLEGIGKVQVPDGWSTTVESERRERFSVTGGVEWQPLDSIDLYATLLYSRFNNAIAENRVSYEFGSYVETALAPGSARINDGVLYAATIAGGHIDRNAEFSKQRHDNLALALGSHWEGAGFSAASTLSLSLANSDLKLPLQRIDSQTTNSAGLSYAFDLGRDPLRSGTVLSLATNLDLTAPDATQFKRYRIRPTNSEDRDATALLNVSRDLGLALGAVDLLAVRFGGQWTSRHRDYQRRDRTLTARDGVTVDSSYFTGAVPTDAMEGIIQGARSIWRGPDYAKFATSFVVAGEYDGVAPQARDLVPNASDLRQSYRVEEDIQALYLRLDFVCSQGGMPLSGNVGLRWVNSGTTVYGVRVPVQSSLLDVMTAVPRKTETGHSVFLPSINAALDVSDSVVIRFAASRSLTRPSLASLRDATVPSSSTVSDIYERGAAALQNAYLDRAAVGGNPSLAPILSWNADGSVERYFEYFGAVTASAFYKSMDNVISGDVSVEAMPFAVRGGGTVALDIAVNRPQNMGKASLFGLELGYSGRLDNGLGLALSAMLTSSDVRLHLADGATKNGSLQGVSDLSFAITPFYDNGLLDIYLSYTYRSAFESNDNVTIASSVETDPSETPVASGFGTLDFGAAVKLNHVFEVFAEGVNLANARQTAYLGRAARLYQIHDYGRTINFGVRGRF